MKIINPKVELVTSTGNILKDIEIAGRVSYKSEDKIKEGSEIDFVKRMVKSGHWATLEFGTIYLKIPVGECSWVMSIITDINRPESKGTRVIQKNGFYYVTTNFRVREQLWYESKGNKIARKDVLKLGKYLVNPDPSVHKIRVNTHWITSVAVSNQALRSRVFSPMQESQRYCNYSKDKFGGEITYVIPYWASKKIFDSLQDDKKTEILETIRKNQGIDPGTVMWNELVKINDKCKKRNDIWNVIEQAYMAEIKSGMLPEEARDILVKQTKTEFYLCGYLDDWFYVPSKKSPEKAGFFSLRTASSAQGDIRLLALDLKEQMEEEYAGPYFKYQTNK